MKLESTFVDTDVSLIAVDTDTAARLLGISPSSVRVHVRRGDLMPRYSGTKPIFVVEDLRAFVLSLPEVPCRL